MTREKPFSLGSVSWGTMRAEDLIPAFLDVLDELDPPRAEALRSEWDALDWDEDVEKAPEGWEETEDEILNDLFDALSECAPEYVHVGSHEGDGADYGFWISWDSLEGDCESGEVLKVSDTGDIPPDYRGLALHVTDHGNASLYSCADDGMHEVWSTV
jgi:hypothetical protein